MPRNGSKAGTSREHVPTQQTFQSFSLVGVEDKGMSYSPSTAFGPVCGVDDGIAQPASPGCGSSQVTHFYLLEFSSSCVPLTIFNYFALCVIDTTIF